MAVRPANVQVVSGQCSVGSVVSSALSPMSNRFCRQSLTELISDYLVSRAFVSDAINLLSIWVRIA